MQRDIAIKYAGEYALNQLEGMKRHKIQLPYLNFPPHWKVNIMPGENALIRFRVKHINQTKNDDNDVSVYLDCCAALAGIKQPYWEKYNADSLALRF